MFQSKEIGKYTKKEDVLNTKVGRTFVLPSGKSYEFTEYRKEGRKYIFLVTYKGTRCQVKESDFYSNIENILTAIDKELTN